MSWKEIGKQFLMWLIGGGVVLIAGTLINFYIEWKSDEATEEHQMFDGPDQKTRVLDHVDKIDAVDMGVKMKLDQEFQKEVLKTLDQIQKVQAHQDTINERTHDQIYQNNQRLKEILPLDQN